MYEYEYSTVYVVDTLVLIPHIATLLTHTQWSCFALPSNSSAISLKYELDEPFHLETDG